MALTLALQLVLSEKVCTALVREIAPRFIDGQVNMSGISVSLLRRFPSVSANIKDLSITYPAERFDSSDAACGRIDTLASFRRFDVAVSLIPLTKGKVRVRNLSLVRPRAFLHFYADGASNLDVVNIRKDTTDGDTPDSPSFELSAVNIRDLSLKGGTFVRYADEAESLALTLLLRSADLRCRIKMSQWHNATVDLALDSLLLFGRSGADTVLFDLDRMSLQGAGGHLAMNASAKAYAATRAFGRLKVPVDIVSSAMLVKEGETLDVDIPDFNANVATVHLDASARAEFGDTIRFCGKLDIPGARAQELLDGYAVNFYPKAASLRTDAVLCAGVSCDGYLADGAVGRLHAKVDNLSVNATGLNLTAGGCVDNLMGRDPLVEGKATLAASLDKFADLLHNALDINVKGDVDADISAKLHLSNLDIYSLGGAVLKGKITGRDIIVEDPEDSLFAYVRNLDLYAGMMESRSQKGSETLGAAVKIDSLSLQGGRSTSVSGRGLNVMAQTTDQKIKISDSLTLNPMRLYVSISGATLRDSTGMGIRIKDSKETFTLQPSRKDRDVTSLRITSENGRISLRAGEQRLMLSGLAFDAFGRNDGNKSFGRNDGTKASNRRDGRIPLRQRGQLPDYMSERDFRKADIKFDLGETFKTYFRQWNLAGRLSLARGAVVTPAFPQRTRLTSLGCNFTNDRVSLDSIRVISGSSNLSARGNVGNLRNVLQGRGVIRLSLDIFTDSLALNQLLGTYLMGQFNMESRAFANAAACADDDKYEAMVTQTQEPDSLVSPLIVVPGNVDADIRLRGRGVSYSTLDISDIRAGIRLYRRCLQLSGLRAQSNIGVLGLDAFYSTKTKSQLCTGFDLSLQQLEAGDVIELIPKIDSLVPLLKSFDGRINCNIAATASIDTNMNIINNSIDGVMRISGSDLHFQDSPEVTKLARKLLFRNPGRATVDTMTVEGVIKDSKLEIFPFILKADRWTFALAGVQNMDNSFDYHVSLIKSPLILKLGANLSGPDFDNIKLRLGRARYRNVNVPVFTKVIDTTRINLRNSIVHIFDMGVEKALWEHRRSGDVLRNARRKAGYDKSAALDSLEALSGKEQESLDSLRTGRQ